MFQYAADVELREQEHVLLPRHRHACLAALMRVVRETRLPVTEGIEYIRALEQHVYNAARGNRSAYMPMLRSMLFNLQQNGKHLMRLHGPAQLPHLDHAVLARGTEMEGWYSTYRTKHREQEDILSSEPINFFEGEDADSLVQCSRCHSSNVIWEQKQTRGADESMTIFFECKNCSKRWKMS